MSVSKPGIAASRPLQVSPAKRLAATVYDEIKASILSGKYAPGEWLSVEDLCRAFQVSRQPVMEAMRRLSGEWLVEIIPQVGCRVTEYDQQAFRDFIVAFGEMEGRVAQLAAERRTTEELARLYSVLDQIGQSTSFDEKHRSLIREFHSTILEMAHSAVLQRLCEQMWDFGDFAWTAMTPSQTPEDLRRQRETYERLAEAIRFRNQGLANLHMAVWLTGFVAQSQDEAGDESSANSVPDGASSSRARISSARA